MAYMEFYAAFEIIPSIISGRFRSIRFVSKAFSLGQVHGPHYVNSVQINLLKSHKLSYDDRTLVHAMESQGPNQMSLTPARLPAFVTECHGTNLQDFLP